MWSGVVYNVFIGVYRCFGVVSVILGQFYVILKFSRFSIIFPVFATKTIRIVNNKNC